MKEKKYGVIWAPTPNIGDDIQTLAAINFLKKKGITEYKLINRERLHKYNGEEVHLIMNGWFMHHIKNFPPSKKIKPIWLSFHVARPKFVLKNLNYFKNQPAIGCRDKHTVNFLKSHGINAYFTGCLTLLFDKHPNKNSKKYLVDVNTECYYIPNIELNMDEFSGFKVVEHDVGRVNLEPMR